VLLPTKRHWTRGKQILRYLNGTKDLGLFFYSFRKLMILAWLDTLMLATGLIPTMPEHIQVLYFFMEELPYHGSLLNKH
jgi:hypothetical protein